MYMHVLKAITAVVIFIHYVCWFVSSVLHREPLPGHWDDDLDEFQKLLVLRCIRADKVTNAMQVRTLYYNTHIYGT